MRGKLFAAGTFAILVLSAWTARADVNPIVVESLTPIHDTYATHDDGLVHGFETFIRVGIEPQQCVPGGWNPCEKDDLECCIAGSGYNYCAEPGECGNTDPSWTAFRKFRSYLRFDLNSLPKGKVLSASLRLTEVGKVKELGGPFELRITALKKIGEEEICEWNEQTLNDTNLTTWNSLPQNVSVTEDGVWFFDVSKAVVDWVNGEQDKPGTPIMPNCGFHFYDDAFGNAGAPIQRWVDFGSKESQHSPQLKIEIAQDLDEDGYYGDCNEEAPAITPGAAKLCDEIDNDCDGQVDEENCDGLDNDCDGLIDEGEGLCGEGQMCIYHSCYATCQDECGSTSKLKCVKNEETGLYERWGCKKDADEDPCFDWYKAQDCAEGEFCNYGYCSGNCIDICDEAGVPQCEKDSTGMWHVAMCKDTDEDGCLDLYDAVPCGPAASCEDATCGTPCTDTCELGTVECDGDSLVAACWDFDQNGCNEMSEVATCDPATAPCEDGECGGQPDPCEDDCLPGATMFDVLDGVATLFECVTDQDADVCLEWGNSSECPSPGLCNTMKNGCEEEVLVDDVVVEAMPDVISQPDVVAIEETVDQPDLMQPDTANDGSSSPLPEDIPSSDDVLISGDITATDVLFDEPEKKDEGCSAGTNSSPTAGLLLLALLLAFVALRREETV